MGSIGLPELVIILGLSLFLWVLPAAAAIWALVTLSRLRHGQEEARRRLEAIERLLQKNAGLTGER